MKEAVAWAAQLAGEQTLPGFPLRWETTTYESGRFEDEDGRGMWDKLQSLLGDRHHVQPPA